MQELNSGEPGKLHPSYAVTTSVASVDTTVASVDTTVASETDTTGASRAWGAASGKHLGEQMMGLWPDTGDFSAMNFAAGAGSKLYGFYLHVFHSPAAVFYQARRVVARCGPKSMTSLRLGNLLGQRLP